MKKRKITLMHEVTHAIETDLMKKLVMDFASKNQEFNQALESLKQTYGTKDVSSEVLADISGQLLGNQEFINNLSMEKPNIFKRLYNSIISLANKITGNSKESLFIKDLKNKWENAYRTQNNNLNGKTNYYIENIASFDENEYNNNKQEILNNLEFANLASIINSDQSVNHGKNIIESIYDYNSGKYKDYEIYYKSSGEFKIIKSKDSGVDSNVKYSKSSDSRNETTGSRQTNNQLGNRVVENTNATSKNDELFDINQRDAHSKRQSNRHDRQNSRELDNSSFSLKQKKLDIILKHNPAEDNCYTWIRNIEDIKIFEETLQDSDYKEYYESTGTRTNFSGIRQKTQGTNTTEA